MSKCPKLFLAPMEGLGDRTFRKAMASVGGFDEAVMDFLSVPKTAHVQSLAKRYDPSEILPTPLACQLMGSDAELMGKMAIEIEAKGAPRIDLNCGCPSNTVTGNGAGSSLLKNPELLHKIASTMCKSVKIPVTLKMRSGYEDTSLFKENLHAASSSGIKFLTIHPRTKMDGYKGFANWDLIALAKELLDIPICGNGDIQNVDDALRMLKTTKCDYIMIGRGAVSNPFIFREIKAHFAGEVFTPCWDMLYKYLQVFISHISEQTPPRGKINKVKQLFSFIFRSKYFTEEDRKKMLTFSPQTLTAFLEFSVPILKEGFMSSELTFK
jgi:nifR3 family TIM-barrel protein